MHMICCFVCECPDIKNVFECGYSDLKIFSKNLEKGEGQSIAWVFFDVV